MPSLTVKLPSRPLPTFTPPTFEPLPAMDVSGSKEAHGARLAIKQVKLTNDFYCFVLFAVG